jgi:hypothetical protein
VLIGEMCVSQWHERACFSFLQAQRSLKAGEITQQESQNMSASSMKLQTETFTAEKVNPRGIFIVL